MKNLRPVLALASALAVSMAGAASAAETSHPFGLGIVVGEPTGLSAKLYLAQPFALQFGAGIVDDFGGRDGFNLNFDFIWHPAVLARNAALTMPFYLGVGARLADDRYDYFVDNVRYVDHDARLGVRAPFGLLLDFNRVPLDLYFELALVIDFVYFDDVVGPYHRDRLGWNGGIGLRYYF
jgi:hypothetical protein